MFVKIGGLINLYFITIIIVIVSHKNAKKNIILILYFIILKLNVHMYAELTFQNG